MTPSATISKNSQHVVKGPGAVVRQATATACTGTWLDHAAGEFTLVLFEDVASDPMLPRTKSVRCAASGHGEAVFFRFRQSPAVAAAAAVPTRRAPLASVTRLGEGLVMLWLVTVRFPGLAAAGAALARALRTYLLGPRTRTSEPQRA
ncbi:DNA-directed RNA polymerases II, IV and V subunit 9B-like [Panicum miliaceum]|uniref:DNA-directed RNA polymerases II, IV and V subunit 9B-like n=1 Tax=Panicum miliaceum TaxID=4540 RepID=A0A3L6RMZ9_PANMI|nr:DNA-directed RNA polymerases II, IV and V subunit 9B-like [Panicum miliaceum]